MKRLLRHPITQAAIARLAALYFKLALGTTRWQLDGRENLVPAAQGTPTVIAFWHEQLALALPLWRLSLSIPGARPIAINALVSRHRDGQLVGSMLRAFGVSLISGSSNNGGAAALRALTTALAHGEHVVFIPDGPRGPRRQAAPGIAQLAAISGAPVLPCAAQTTRHITMRSWDRMVIPLPFGRGVMVCGPAIPVPRNDWRAALPQIAAGLTAVADRADALMQT